jgi:hypothetical protein
MEGNFQNIFFGTNYVRQTSRKENHKTSADQYGAQVNVTSF